MLWKTIALLAASVLAMGAAPAPKAAPPKSAVAKPAAAKAAAKPAPKAAPAAAAEAGFDARDPASMVALLGSAGAVASVAHKEADAVFLTVTSTAANFSVQYAGCDDQGRKCRAMLFDNATDKASPPLGQLNAYNQTSAMCRGFMDKAGKAHVVYSTLVFADDNRARMVSQLGAWQGCIAEFRDFLKDPTAYLASAP
jgi:hypothetical protein